MISLPSIAIVRLATAAHTRIVLLAITPDDRHIPVLLPDDEDPDEYIIVDTESDASLCRLLAAGSGLADPGLAAWVRLDLGGWGLWVVDWASEAAGEPEPYDLEGVPDGVTDPDEALAWAFCWWASASTVRGEPVTWEQLRAACDEAREPCLVPLVDGVAMEVPRD